MNKLVLRRCVAPLVAPLHIACIALLLVGCGRMSSDDLAAQGQLFRDEIGAREQIIDRREAILQRREQRVEELEAQILRAQGDEVPAASEVAMGLYTGSSETLFPPIAARSGRCYALAYLPPRIVEQPEDYIYRPAHIRYKITPAVLKEERVSVESLRRNGQATSITIKPAYNEYHSTEPVFQQRSERYIKQPVTLDFGPCETVDYLPLAGRFCPRTQDALYDDVRLEALIEPASLETIVHEPEVLVLSPGKLGAGASITKQSLVSDAVLEELAVPELLKSRSVQDIELEARIEWRQVWCGEQQTSARLRALQAALAERGFNPGKPDGELGASTLEALTEFQLDQNMAVSAPKISVEAAKVLEVD